MTGQRMTAADMAAIPSTKEKAKAIERGNERITVFPPGAGWKWAASHARSTRVQPAAGKLTKGFRRPDWPGHSGVVIFCVFGCWKTRRQCSAA